MKKTFLLCVAIFAFSIFAHAQPRMVENKPKPNPTALSRESFKAKYEGGMFGFNRKEEGVIRFDDANLRVVFFDKNNKELFGIPYKSIQLVYPNSKSVQSTTGKVIQNVPFYGVGIAGAFMRDKKKYMIISFDDTDLNAKGTTSFKVETRQLLQEIIQTVGSKAELKQRGDSFYR